MAASTTTFTHSKHLFLEEDGSNMQFYMCPCAERVKLKPLVEHGGGSISNRRMKNSVMLTADLSKTYTEDYYSFKYILDCVKYNRLLRITKYKLSQPASTDSSTDDDMNISDDMSPASTIIRTEARNCKGRKEYKHSDDMNMITYIMSERRHSEIRGNKLWNDMETLGITTHTAQSMRARFLKVALPRITQYPVSRQWIAILTNTKTARPALEFHGSPTVTSSTEKICGQKTDNGSPQKRSHKKQPIIVERSSDDETAAVTTETKNAVKARDKTTPMETRNRQHSAPEDDWQRASEPSGSKHKMTLRKEGKNAEGEQQVMECTSTGSPHRMTLKKGVNIGASDDDRQTKHLPTRSTTALKVTSKSVVLETAKVHKKSHKSNLITVEVHNERDTRNLTKDTHDVSSSQKEMMKAVEPINAIVVCRNSEDSSPSSRRNLRNANTRKQTEIGVAEKGISENKKRQNSAEFSGISTKKATAVPRVSHDSDSEDEYLIEAARNLTTNDAIGDRNNKMFKKGIRDKSSTPPTKAPKVDTHKAGPSTVQKSPVKPSSTQIVKPPINGVPQVSHHSESDSSDDLYLFELARKRKPCRIISDSNDEDDPHDKRRSPSVKFRKVDVNNADDSSEDGNRVKCSVKSAAKSQKKTGFMIQSKIFPQKSLKVADVEIPSNSKAMKGSGTNQDTNVSRADLQLDPKNNKFTSVKTSKPIQNVKVCESKTAKRKTISPENPKQSKKVPRPCAGRGDTSKSSYIAEWVKNYSSSEGSDELVDPNTIQQCLDDLSEADDFPHQSVEPDSSSQEIMMPVRNRKECSTEDVDTVCDIVKELSAAFRLPISDIVFALSANRGDVVATIDWLTTGQAQNGKLDWRPEEDRILLNSDNDAIEKLLERHDLETIEQRASFLENLNLTL